jgi:serine/threonine protein kinase
VDYRGEGDIVNMSALFTGEPSMANVEAETEIEVWVIKKAQFEAIPESNPRLWKFLTEIVADRFDSKRPTSYRTIGKYLATDIIGRGGYSIVYKGMEMATKKTVAIKMIRHHIALDSDFLEKLRKEAEIVNKLYHDNIIKVYDMVERYRTVFIIMEYLEGESILEKIQRDKTVVPHLAINYLMQSCLAIEYAHNKSILHKDINPGNIMVLNDGTVKLVDFGLACYIQDDDELFDGAFSYLAPELIKGENADLRSEIYALGISAFEIVAGKRPYPEENQSAFTRMRCVQEIPDPQNIIPEIPRNLRQFILKACRINPEERYSGIGEAIKELKYEEDQLSLSIKNIDIVAQTHIGLVKSSNEDRYLVRTMDDNALLLAVADGLGGNVSSDVAAEITKDRLSRLKYLKQGKEIEGLDTFARDLDLIIHEKALADSGLTYMATTLTCVVLKSDMIHWLNAGDSRFYILRDDQLLQITQDHTLARVLVEEGRLKPEDADEHYSSKILDQCLGYGMCDPETGSIRVKKNDLIILATDGMYKMVKEKTILQILKTSTTLEKKIEALMNSALKSGGEDDITLVLTYIKEILT